MAETLTLSEPLIEQAPDLIYKTNVLREAGSFVQSSIGGTVRLARTGYLSTEEAFEGELAQLQTDESIGFAAQDILGKAGNIYLRSDYSANPEIYTEDVLKEQVGLLDEDSFVFTWQVLDKLAELDEAKFGIEQTAEHMLAKLREFTSNNENFQRAVRDPRLAGLFHLNSAVEFAQIKDFDTARKELEHIPEERLRSRFLKSLEEAMSLTAARISPQESHANLETYAKVIGAPEIPLDAEIDTRVVSNCRIETLKEMFDPLSNGRMYASTGSKRAFDRPSSGDNDVRRRVESELGHHRRLFLPRVVYGTLVETDHIEDRSDNGWAFGEVRVVLKEKSDAAEDATFTFGDSLNGTTFTHDRLLLREDADKASQILRQANSLHKPDLSAGSVSHYIEAQLNGLRISDVESIVLYPESLRSNEREETLKAAEVAALHGIDVSYVLNWQSIIERNRARFPDQHQLAGAIKTLLTKDKILAPHVQLKIGVQDKADARLFEDLDREVASIIVPTR